MTTKKQETLFWKRFVNLCAQVGLSPNAVCKDLGLSSATATHWKNGSIPNDIAKNAIASYFNVPVEILTNDAPFEIVTEPDPIIQKIGTLLHEQGKSQKNLTDYLGITQNAFTDWKSGRIKSYRKHLSKIAEFLNVSVDYLLGNTDEIRTPLPANIFPITRKRFRMLGAIACGEPRYADQDHETYVEASADIQADFCLTAKGDSMIGARILDGDIVFIREQPMVEDGEIAAVIIDDEATLKRVKYNKEKQQLTLFPANDKYDPLVFIGEELNQIRILGKAVCFMSNL